jgi:hypothetical protein
MPNLKLVDKPIGYPHWTTHEGLSGWMAVRIWWNPEGFPEPWETGHGRYPTEPEAAHEAQDLARAEGVPFYR